MCVQLLQEDCRAHSHLARHSICLHDDANVDSCWVGRRHKDETIHSPTLQVARQSWYGTQVRTPSVHGVRVSLRLHLSEVRFRWSEIWFVGSCDWTLVHPNPSLTMILHSLAKVTFHWKWRPPVNFSCVQSERCVFRVKFMHASLVPAPRPTTVCVIIVQLCTVFFHSIDFVLKNESPRKCYKYNCYTPKVAFLKGKKNGF